jgi:Protein of unknown function (DUF2490)
MRLSSALLISIWMILFSIPLVLSAQKHIDDQNNAWVWYVGNHRFTDRWGLHTEYGWRRNDFFEHWMQSQIRVAVEYYTKQGPVVSAGYSFIDSWQYGEQPAAYRSIEHRAYEQFGTSQQIGRFYTSNRVRIEQRWIENKAKNADQEYERSGSDPFIYKNRVRFRYMVNIPITRKTMENNTLFLAASDEIFVNSGKEIKLNALDQNRVYGALGWRIDKNRNIQIGYLNQYIIKGDAKKVERNHTVQLGITWGLDFRKPAAVPAPPAK